MADATLGNFSFNFSTPYHHHGVGNVREARISWQGRQIGTALVSDRLTNEVSAARALEHYQRQSANFRLDPRIATDLETVRSRHAKLFEPVGNPTSARPSPPAAAAGVRAGTAGGLAALARGIGGAVRALPGLSVVGPLADAVEVQRKADFILTGAAGEQDQRLNQVRGEVSPVVWHLIEIELRKRLAPKDEMA